MIRTFLCILHKNDEIIFLPYNTFGCSSPYLNEDLAKLDKKVSFGFRNIENE